MGWVGGFTIHKGFYEPELPKHKFCALDTLVLDDMFHMLLAEVKWEYQASRFLSV